MFIGEYTHLIDAKKRLAIPSKFRKALGKAAVITRGLDNCLFLFPLKEWKVLSNKLSQLPIGQQDARGFNRLMMAGAAEVELDSLGRILIPEYLKSLSGLEKKVVLAGLGSRIEVWDEKIWQNYKETVEKEAGSLAEKMGQMGI